MVDHAREVGRGECGSLLLKLRNDLLGEFIEEGKEILEIHGEDLLELAALLLVVGNIDLEHALQAAYAVSKCFIDLGIQ